MARIVEFIFSLGGLMASLAVAALWLNLRPASRAPRRFLLAVLAVYALASVYAVPYALSRVLVTGFHELSAGDVPPGRTAIVTLSGGTAYVEDWNHRRFFHL